jgi:O-phospho-L-seryl-tRNASec:L-selenocysteinyl-tRNA synthase
VCTDLAALEAEVVRLGAGSIAAVVTTTSCFAPRGPDKLIDVVRTMPCPVPSSSSWKGTVNLAWLGLQAKLCKEHGITHIVNNAYGVQSAALCRLITAACRKGRVDAIVQSTDKNFMVCDDSMKHEHRCLHAQV